MVVGPAPCGARLAREAADAAVQHATARAKDFAARLDVTAAALEAWSMIASSDRLAAVVHALRVLVSGSDPRGWPACGGAWRYARAASEGAWRLRRLPS